MEHCYWAHHKYLWVNAIHPAGISTTVMKSRWKSWEELFHWETLRTLFTEKSSGSKFPGRIDGFKARVKSTASLYAEWGMALRAYWLSLGKPKEWSWVVSSTEEQGCWVSGLLTTPRRASVEDNDEGKLTEGGEGERKGTEKEETRQGACDSAS